MFWIILLLFAIFLWSCYQNFVDSIGAEFSLQLSKMQFVVFALLATALLLWFMDLSTQPLTIHF
jgi:drug/metabolite transporter (DMT)-like permease